MTHQNQTTRTEEKRASRFCIAKDGKKWRVYDDARKQFAEPYECASSKDAARARAQAMNGAAVLS